MPETPLRTQALPLRSRILTSGLDNHRPMTRPGTYEGTNLLVFWVSKLYVFIPITFQESHLPYRALKDLQSRKGSDSQTEVVCVSPRRIFIVMGLPTQPTLYLPLPCPITQPLSTFLQFLDPILPRTHPPKTLCQENNFWP